MRRGGRDRYRSSDLKRGVVRDNYSPPDRWESTDSINARSASEIARRAPVIECRHGAVWTMCTQCSKPRARNA